MGSVAKEDGVLKLVHPGKNVEIYRKPVTAAQVMSKYPRHSVTRPDFFKYPWVVVRPESVLKLGKVFFVVPNRTIYKLLKAHRQCNRQDSSCQMLSPNKHTHQQQKHHHQQEKEQYQDSPVKINAGSTPKHQTRQPKLNQSPPSPTISCMWMSSHDQDRDLKTKNQNKVGSWPEVITPKNNRNNHLRLEEKQVKGSRFKIQSFDRYLESADTDITAEFHKREDGHLLEFEQSREVTVLKSCLRKPDSARKSLKLQVSFLLPAKDEEQKRIKVSTEDLVGSNSCSFTDFFVQSESLALPQHELF